MNPNQTIITEINIVPVKPKNGLVGFASFVVDDKLYIGNVAIFTRRDGNGIRLVYPTKPVGTRQIDCVHPISQDAGIEITNAIQKKYIELFSYFPEEVNEAPTWLRHSAE